MSTESDNEVTPLEAVQEGAQAIEEAIEAVEECKRLEAQWYQTKANSKSVRLTAMHAQAYIDSLEATQRSLTDAMTYLVDRQLFRDVRADRKMGYC